MVVWHDLSDGKIQAQHNKIRKHNIYDNKIKYFKIKYYGSAKKKISKFYLYFQISLGPIYTITLSYSILEFC